jgi:DNA-binding response OmpR family regulator
MSRARPTPTATVRVAVLGDDGATPRRTITVERQPATQWHHRVDMPGPTILVVDDEPPIIDLVRGYLERDGFTVHAASDGPSAVAAVRDLVPDVVVLDVMLPGFDGVEACRQIRSFSDAYVLMLTARSEEIDRVVGLSVGADDYLTKPFSPRELVARVKALLRRPRTLPAVAEASTAQGQGQGPAGLTVDLPRRTATVDGRRVALTTTEFEILALLSRDPGVVVTRQALLDAVWGVDFVGDDHLVDVHVANLRRKLGDDVDARRFIETVRGAGYRLVEST